MTKKDCFQKLVDLAGMYNADIELVGNMAFIRYKVLGQGSILSDIIAEQLGGRSYGIKMIPSDCRLEVSIYD